ncbi:hypothetical protein LNP74_12750 [Klebsiella pneumoniae subsp. pneumoniae]|nr:hypothetical protein [Klebsiella pneumoniae subsp. pneumoniae]
MGLFAKPAGRPGAGDGPERLFRLCGGAGDGAAVAGGHGRHLLGRRGPAAADHLPRTLLDDRQYSA